MVVQHHGVQGNIMLNHKVMIRGVLTMKCILCDAKMLQGGIVTQGVSVTWIPQIEFQKKGIKKLIYKNGKNISWES